jgi:hypothetical protein
MVEVAIGGEDLPLMAFRDRTQQEIYRGPRDTSSPAIVAHSRSLFKVIDHQRGFLVQTQSLAQANKLRLFAYPGENLLADRPNQLGPAIANEVRQSANQDMIGCRQSVASIPQSEGPD